MSITLREMFQKLQFDDSSPRPFLMTFLYMKKRQHCIEIEYTYETRLLVTSIENNERKKSSISDIATFLRYYGDLTNLVIFSDQVPLDIAEEISIPLPESSIKTKYKTILEKYKEAQKEKERIQKEIDLYTHFLRIKTPIHFTDVVRYYSEHKGSHADLFHSYVSLFYLSEYVNAKSENKLPRLTFLIKFIHGSFKGEIDVRKSIKLINLDFIALLREGLNMEYFNYYFKGLDQGASVDTKLDQLQTILTNIKKQVKQEEKQYSYSVEELWRKYAENETTMLVCIDKIIVEEIARARLDYMNPKSPSPSPKKPRSNTETVRSLLERKDKLEILNNMQWLFESITDPTFLQEPKSAKQADLYKKIIAIYYFCYYVLFKEREIKKNKETEIETLKPVRAYISETYKEEKYKVKTSKKSETDPTEPVLVIRKTFLDLLTKTAGFAKVKEMYPNVLGPELERYIEQELKDLNSLTKQLMGREIETKDEINDEIDRVIKELEGYNVTSWDDLDEMEE